MELVLARCNRTDLLRTIVPPRWDDANVNTRYTKRSSTCYATCTVRREKRKKKSKYDAFDVEVLKFS